jgi:hypothetical protein
MCIDAAESKYQFLNEGKLLFDLVVHQQQQLHCFYIVSSNIPIRLAKFERNFTKCNFYFVTQFMFKYNFYFETEGVSTYIHTYIHTWSREREREIFLLGVSVDGGGYCLGSSNKYNPRFQWSHVVQEPSQLACFSNPNVRCQFFLLEIHGEGRAVTKQTEAEIGFKRGPSRLLIN